MLLKPTWLEKIDLEIHIATGFDENGSLDIFNVVHLKASVEDEFKVSHLPDGSKAIVRKKAFIFTDIDTLPERFVGKVFIDGEEYQILSTKILFSPVDGSRHHFVLEMA